MVKNVYLHELIILSRCCKLHRPRTSARQCKCSCMYEHNQTTCCWYIEMTVVHFWSSYCNIILNSIFIILNMKAFWPFDHVFAWWIFKWIFYVISATHTSSSVMSTFCWKPPLCLNRQRREPWRESGGRSATSSLLRRAARRRRCMLTDWKTGVLERPN